MNKNITDEEINNLAEQYTQKHGLGFGNKTSFKLGFKAALNLKMILSHE